MPTAEAIIQTIRAAFGSNEYPGDAFLAGSAEGCEPEEEVGPFRRKTNWQELEAAFLDGQSGALNFFSEAALRFFLPAFLVADLQGRLERTDPVFVLTHGFHDRTLPLPVGDRTIAIKSGKSAFVNPRRYGAMTFGDHARARLSVFVREEAAAIVEYLKWRRAGDGDEIDRPEIEAALDNFWRERAHAAPTRADLQRYLDEQAAYLEAVSRPPE